MTVCPLWQRLFADQRFVGRIRRNRLVSFKSATNQSALRSWESEIHHQMAKPYFNLKVLFAANVNVFKLFAIDLKIRCSPVPNKRTTANFTLKTRLSRFNSPSVVYLMLLGSAVFHCHLIYM